MIPRGNRSVLRRGSDDNSQGSSKQGNQRDGRLHPRHGRAHQNNDLGRASPSGQGRLGFFQQSRREDASNNSSLQAAIPLSREGKNIARQGSPLLTGSSAKSGNKHQQNDHEKAGQSKSLQYESGSSLHHAPPSQLPTHVLRSSSNSSSSKNCGNSPKAHVPQQLQAQHQPGRFSLFSGLGFSNHSQHRSLSSSPPPAPAVLTGKPTSQQRPKKPNSGLFFSSSLSSSPSQSSSGSAAGEELFGKKSVPEADGTEESTAAETWSSASLLYPSGEQSSGLGWPLVKPLLKDSILMYDDDDSDSDLLAAKSIMLAFNRRKSPTVLSTSLTMASTGLFSSMTKTGSASRSASTTASLPSLYSSLKKVKNGITEE